MFRHRRHGVAASAGPSAAPELDLVVRDDPPPVAVSPDGEDHAEEWRALLELFDQGEA